MTYDVLNQVTLPAGHAIAPELGPIAAPYPLGPETDDRQGHLVDRRAHVPAYHELRRPAVDVPAA